ncbi:MAG: protein kinase [Thermoanaerobaculia bacterium]
MLISAGSRLGPYEVSAKLGEGGMGEVYRATDTKLDREVAIKVLPAAFTADPERLARFEREAKLLAQLHHSHIASIFGFEESGGVRALVMELVEGPTLAERLESGALSVDESLGIARQIAEALEAAHEKGIVHRDLKPQNVKLTRDGAVKVLDFGLAKAMEAGGAPVSGDIGRSPTIMNSPTLTAAHGTQLGVILGTAAYMAPEQARGSAVDKRADIWAFGVVLYEMLTGASLFAGDTVSDTLAGVLKTEIDLARLPESTPATIRRMLRRCLERNPKNRLHDIADARIVIDEVMRGEADEPGPSQEVGAAAPRRPSWFVPALLATVAVAGVAAGWLLRPEREGPATDLELALAIPSGYTVALNNYPGISISADGRRQVVAVADENQTTRLLVRDLDRAESRILPGTEGAIAPALSPDGEAVAFFQGGTLMRMSLQGGPPLVLVQAGADFRGATWSSDGYFYFSPGSGTALSRVPETGGTVEPVTELDSDRKERTHRWPAALPDGSAVLFTCDTVASTEFYDDARIEAVRPATGERKVVLEGTSQASFLAPDHLLFARGGSLLVIRFDPRTLETSGPPSPIVQRVSTEVSSGAVRFAVAASGAVAWIPGTPGSQLRELLWIDGAGKSSSSGLPPDRYNQILLSPDGRRLAAAIDGSSNADLWIFDLGRDRKMRFTFGGSATDMVWSPDGSRLAYSTTAAGSGMEMYWKLSDGSGESERIVHLDGEEFAGSFTPDGRALLFEHDAIGRADSDIERLDLATGKVEPLLNQPHEELLPAISPDGRWLAYASIETGTVAPQIVVTRYPELSGKWQVSLDGGMEPRWSPEGDALYFRSNGTLLRVPVETAGGFATGKAVALSDGMPRGTMANTFTVARGGRVLVVRDLNPEERPREVHFALDLASRARRLTEPKR